MGFYSTRLLPALLDRYMSSDEFSRIRRDVLSRVRGDTLEIGFGTGLNLAHYPPALAHLTAIDANSGMSRLAASRIARVPFGVDARTLDAESLPFGDCRFDTVVSTWTLCSVRDTHRALREIYRVLKPDGQFLFVEHGSSAEGRIQKWQRRLTPLQMKLADGCRLDRNIKQLLLEAEFQLPRLETFYMDGVPRIGGFLYRGVATRSASSAALP